MSRVLLVVANVTRDPYPVFPLGPVMVAAAARDRGHDVVLWDHLFEAARGDTLEAALERVRPDVVGISLRNIDNIDSVGLESYVGWYRELVEDLRERTDRPVVLGGSAFSLLPERLLAELGADYGVIGEGEEAFCDLLERLQSGEEPRERLRAASHPLPPERISGARRDPELTRFYLREGGMLNVQTKRGCPFRCSYCTYPLLEGNEYRLRSAPAVVDEITELRGRSGADFVAFTDSVFNDARGRYLEIAEELVRRNTGIRWMAYFRPGRFSPDDVRLLRRSGLANVEWGSDATTDTTLAGLHKGFTWQEVTECNRLFSQAGIYNAHFVICGGPGETAATLRDGIANIDRLENCVVFVFRGVRVLPGTAIQRTALEQGVITPGQDLLEPVFYHSPEVEPKRMHELLLAAFDGRIDRVYPPASANRKGRTFHRLGYRGPVWDLLLSEGRRRP